MDEQYELRDAVDWLIELKVTDVFMESTGKYWVPIFNVFAESDLQLSLANPAHIKNVPGRKTDVKDAEWIAQLGTVGLIQSSYLPCPEALKLRLLTRRRLSYTQKRTQTKNELHNILQRSNIKLTSYLSDVFGTTGQALLELFINGDVLTLEAVESCRHGKVKATSDQLLKALDGKMSRTDWRLLEDSLDEYRFYSKKLDHIETDIQGFVRDHFPEENDLLMEILV